MNTPDCIQCICLEFRKLFSSDEDMARALRVDVLLARAMVKGEAYPPLDAMVEMQAALRHLALSKEKAAREATGAASRAF
jgi:hypothetical protein